MTTENKAYAAAGVDVEAGYRAVELMKSHIARTLVNSPVSTIGGFGGMFELDTTGIERPVLVSGTDGVGTKIKIAMLMNRHDTIGIDCVAMCVNDIICCGAKPLFFLDYIACGKNYPEKIATIVSGIAEGCVQADCALVGGETAEHPGLMPPDDYDLAGFSVGVVDKCKILDTASVRSGDVIIGLASSGLHSNGFSLVRKVLLTDENALAEPFGGSTIGEVLLTPTRIYVKPVLALLGAVQVKSICHITGGGFQENIPRSLPSHLGAKIDTSAIDTPPIFGLIEQRGGVSKSDMYNTFNMGVGMTVVVSPREVDDAIASLKASGVEAGVIGEVVENVGVELF
ncbi:MAG: phosphoribosylformylglycinamidine cyclo-ligase [Oscillospiraceae bacterium]|nr:phosphoribosylformylglycinamidine cyclo-ligase [Oscillospiraceae bacterium]